MDYIRSSKSEEYIKFEIYFVFLTISPKCCVCVQDSNHNQMDITFQVVCCLTQDTANYLYIDTVMNALSSLLF